MITIQRRHRVSVRNAIIFAGFAALAVLLGVPAKAYEMQHLQPNDEGQIEFIMPSGNIGCVYTPEGGTSVYGTVDGLAEIQCDRVEPDYIRTVLGGQGEAYIVQDLGEFSCCGLTQKLAYDHVATIGPFQCLSTTKGLTCAREDGHGFFLSRALVQTK